MPWVEGAPQPLVRLLEHGHVLLHRAVVERLRRRRARRPPPARRSPEPPSRPGDGVLVARLRRPLLARPRQLARSRDPPARRRAARRTHSWTRGYLCSPWSAVTGGRRPSTSTTRAGRVQRGPAGDRDDAPPVGVAPVTPRPPVRPGRPWRASHRGATPSSSSVGHRVRLEEALEVGRDVAGPQLAASPRPARRDASRPSSRASESTPTACAPSMSVSRRSPTISGRSPPTRRMVSSISGRAGLPATMGSTPAKSRSGSAPAPRDRAPGRSRSGSSCRCCSRRRAARRGSGSPRA